MPLKTNLLVSVFLLLSAAASGKMVCSKSFVDRALDHIATPSVTRNSNQNPPAAHIVSLANTVYLPSADPWQNANHVSRPRRSSDDDDHTPKILLIAGASLVAIGIVLYFLADAPTSTSSNTTTLSSSQKAMQTGGIIAAIVGGIMVVTACVMHAVENRGSGRGNWYD